MVSFSEFGEDRHGVSSHLGAVRCFSGDSDEDGDKEHCWHHQYYQWVALVLMLQAGCFYLPK